MLDMEIAGTLAIAAILADSLDERDFRLPVLGKGHASAVVFGWPRPTVDRSHGVFAPDYSAAERCSFSKAA